jgi:hypothetical protein
MTSYSRETTPASPAGTYSTGYGQPPVFAQARNGLGTAALVLGILALALCWTVLGGIALGVVAVILGLQGRARSRRAEATNGGSALAGTILGALGMLASIALIVVGLSIFNSPAGKNLRSCLANAHGNQAAISQCNSQFAANH